MQPEKLVADIIKEQSLIIGESLAKSRAESTGIIKFKSSNIEDISISNGSPSETIEKVVQSYEQVFGQASVEVCISVIRRFPADDVNMFLPESLKSRVLAR
ncbi:MAG TPA: hypothetical protein VLI92_02855 [Candidatus Saccharimonadales bacterium]|nr:hypothetical protein [Candidatus Saccharimonadales bacterium]